MVPGIILAAGLSVRMGRSKAVLPVGEQGPTFVGRIAAALSGGGAEPVLVVGRPNDDELRAEVVRLGDLVRLVENHHAEQGQLSSVIAGLQAADGPLTIGILVTPVDVPLISSETVKALLAAFDRTHAPIVRATYDGRHGHPVIFARSVFDELRRADPCVGAKAVLRARAREILDVDVPDAGVVTDVDDAEDYLRLFGRRF
jgi:molybdenum cofactor cytidylyltransferase